MYNAVRSGGTFCTCPNWTNKITTPDDLDRKSELVTVCDLLTFAWPQERC